MSALTVSSASCPDLSEQAPSSPPSGPPRAQDGPTSVRLCHLGVRCQSELPEHPLRVIPGNVRSCATTAGVRGRRSWMRKATTRRPCLPTRSRVGRALRSSARGCACGHASGPSDAVVRPVQCAGHRQQTTAGIRSGIREPPAEVPARGPGFPAAFRPLALASWCPLGSCAFLTVGLPAVRRTPTGLSCEQGAPCAPGPATRHLPLPSG